MNELFKLQSPYPLPKLKCLPLREQPAYRVSQKPDACNLVELLAVLVGGKEQIEVAEALLGRFGSIRRLHQAHISEIADINGIGQSTAVRLKAALALGKKAVLETEDERPIIHCPADAVALVEYDMSLFDQEYLKVMLLDTRNRVIEISEIYHGSVNASQVRVAELFKPAIQRNAASIIAFHNHPSSDPTPSPDDVAVTRAIIHAGKLLDLPILDHIVVGRIGHYISMKERGLAFDNSIQERRAAYRVREDHVIYAYTRAQALADGVLVDVSTMAAQAGFRCPTVITADLHAALQTNEREASSGQSYEGRLWDVLWLASLAARIANRDNRAEFNVSLAVCPGNRGPIQRRNLNLWVHIGPGDSGEPVITIGYPEDF